MEILQAREVSVTEYCYSGPVFSSWLWQFATQPGTYLVNQGNVSHLSCPRSCSIFPTKDSPGSFVQKSTRMLRKMKRFPHFVLPKSKEKKRCRIGHIPAPKNRLTTQTLAIGQFRGEEFAYFWFSCCVFLRREKHLPVQWVYSFRCCGVVATRRWQGGG